MFKWNLVPRLIRICRIQWWCPFFSVFDRKYYFWASLVQKIKIISLSTSLVPILIQIYKINGDFLFFFRFRPDISFLGKSASKNQLSVKIKFGTKTNLNMQNSMVVFTFSCFWPEIPILGKFIPKIQNCLK